MKAESCTAGRPADRGLDGWIDAFVSPVTRMLLASDGMTTPLLEAVARQRVRADVRSVVPLPAARLGAAAVAALGLRGEEPCLVRRTRLVAADGLVVSSNCVVARAGCDERIDRVVGDPAAPLGFALQAAGVVLRRRLVDAGREVWPEPGGGCCVVKAYTMSAAGRPVLYLRELFNPALIPAELRG
ncbi:hypothetical protein ACFYNO_31530 [Kitasatospora sp. NPDC006697]|uniref:hypothetical protein n=1 Tax=Kitasatospora sp. NPDC006697 TaxID=3364020 RepID=UPI00368A8A6D